MEAPSDALAFTLMLSSDGAQPDGLAVVDVDPKSKTYGEIVHQVIMPNTGDEFHHFGWNACSSSLSPLSGHAFLERRYLIIPGIRSSRIYIIDVKGPLKAKIHKIIDPGQRWLGRHQRSSGHIHHGLRNLRDPRQRRDGSRRAGQALRSLVEPAARLHGQQRMGPAATVRE